jgi:hypothetical protein
MYDELPDHAEFCTGLREIIAAQLYRRREKMSWFVTVAGDLAQAKRRRVPKHPPSN